MKKLNQNGAFALIVVLLIMLIAVLGGVGYVVYKVNRPTVVNINQDTSNNQQSSVSNIYTDDIGRFTVEYPKDWTVATENDDQNGDGTAPTQKGIFTSPSGYKFSFYTWYGGRGGACMPADSDTPHADTNQCSTYEELSNEPINEKVTTLRYNSSTGKGSLVESDLQLVRIKYSDPGKASRYFIGLGDSEKGSENPSMGATYPLTGLSLADESAPDNDVRIKLHIEVEADSGISPDHFNSPDVKQAEQILKSFRFKN